MMRSLLDSMVKGERVLLCSTAAAATALPVTAVTEAVMTATGTAAQASKVLKMELVGAQDVPSADSAAVMVDPANSAAVWVAMARSTAALECLAPFAEEG